MADINDEIDRLYQGPLDGFIDRRNALAKAVKRPDVKSLAKPSVPAWAVNQLYWHERPVLDRLVAASEAVLGEHRRTLAGERSDLRTAEQAHREALAAALAAAKGALTSGGQAATPSTIETVRETLQSLPSPEANGRLVRPLTPRGLEALAGLVLAARPGPAPAAAPRPAPPAPARRGVPAAATAPAAETRREQAARERAELKARAEAEKAAAERTARRVAAEAAVTKARAALASAEEAVQQAEREVVTRQAERTAAREALKRAQREAEELSFGR